MFNYHDLKVLHIFVVAVFFLSMAVSMYNPEKLLHKIVSGIASLLVLVSGVILLDRFGISHKGPYPTWVLIKAGIWLAISVVTPIVVKKFPKVSKLLYWPWIIVLLVGISMAIYKPL